MKKLKIVLIPSIIMAILQLQGCIVAAVGAGIAAVKYANSQKTEACLKNYNEYLKVAKKPMSLSQYCAEADK